MSLELKRSLKAKARYARGLVKLLADDVEQLRMDTDEYDILSLEVGIKETRDTLQKLIDVVTELDYELYLSRRSNTRYKHTPL